MKTIPPLSLLTLLIFSSFSIAAPLDPWKTTLLRKPILVQPTPEYVEKIKKAMAATKDILGEEEISRPEGPTYENIQGVIAPIRYVNTPFIHYPIILGPRGGPEKIRLISDGSQIDAGLTMETPLDIAIVWPTGNRHLLIQVGENQELFGSDENRTSDPVYEDGYLPVVSTKYQNKGVTYEETVFAAPIHPEYNFFEKFGQTTAAYIKITADGPGQVAFKFDAPHPDNVPLWAPPWECRNGVWTDGYMNQHVWFYPKGEYADGVVRFYLDKDQAVYALLPHSALLPNAKLQWNPAKFDVARQQLLKEWQQELAGGSRIQVPEKVVMNAYRSLLIGNWMTARGDILPYSIFNFYGGRYQNAMAESLQMVAPCIEWGYFDEAKKQVSAFLDYPFSDKGVGLHVAANRLELAAMYYGLSQDAGFIKENAAKLKSFADSFLEKRDAKSGLLLDSYAVDRSHDRVYNLNTNCNGWRGIRDIARALIAAGENEAGGKYLEISHDFGQKVRAAVTQSLHKEVDPPFLPFSLLGTEKVYANMTESLESSYYNLVAPYFYESELFDPHSEPVTALLRTQEEKGGVLLGLNRFDPHSALYAGNAIHPLYTWGRAYALMLRQEPEKYLVAFYSALANSYTRGTFIAGEFTGIQPEKGEFYRRFYLPPNTATNALFLRMLRHMLVHEQDTNQDGVFEELWLLSATPRGWMEDGKEIHLTKMPSRFGKVSLNLISEMAQRKIRGEISLEALAEGKKVLLFVRIPGGARIRTATLNGGTALKVDEAKQTVELPGKPGKHTFTVEF